MRVNKSGSVTFTAREFARFGRVAPQPAAPVSKRTFATKAERAKGNGFACPNCARTDLRVAPVAGRSFHDKDVKGNSVVCDLR